MKRTFVLLLIAFSFIALVFMAAPSFAVEAIPTDGNTKWTEFHGSRLLSALDRTTILTDASPTISYTVNTLFMTDLVVDLTMDKGGTIVITPLPDVDVLATEGLASDAMTIPDLGGTDRAVYSKIAAPNAKVTVTKTEAGSTTSFLLSIRGVQQ